MDFHFHNCPIIMTVRDWAFYYHTFIIVKFTPLLFLEIILSDENILSLCILTKFYQVIQQKYKKNIFFIVIRGG